MGEISRRELLAAGAAAGAAAWLFKGRAYAQDTKVPIAVSSGNGLRAVAKACEGVGGSSGARIDLECRFELVTCLPVAAQGHERCGCP